MSVLSLTDSVTVLTGVGPKRLTALNQLGIATISDLLYYFPFRYEDLKVKDLSEAVDQEKVTLKGTVVADPVVSRWGPGKTRLNVRLLINHDVIMVTFFNQPYLKDKFEAGVDIAVYGKWDARRNSLTGMKVLAVQSADNPSFAAIYSTNKNVRQGTLVKLIREAFDNYQSVIPDLIPADIRERYKLVSEVELIAEMHFPESYPEAKQARRTAIFHEFFLYQLQLQAIKQADRHVENGLALPYQNAALKEFIKTLPFDLTDAQKRVVNEICLDLKAPAHMNRLLQGDVGSGKTIVAAIAMFAAVTAGFQAALMVPTEILAEQHYQSLQKLYAPMNVTVGLLTGSTTAKERRTLLADIESGRINIIVGTHALIQDAVVYHKLGFAVIDEQHRFGVNQRRVLREKGLQPDMLAMTATPIPRTLAITAYGEMDVSTIDELPKGRIPIETSWVRSNQVEQALSFVQKQLADNSQVFAITPLIAESEQMDLKNAEEIYATLAERFEPQYHVALLHGKLKDDEKNRIMTAFSNNEIQLLVSTTVVEVGVDVPNATVMMIFDADRFGLAQLHQLRGRVGRGKKKAYCLLIADPKNQQGVDRMTIMTETTNGFVIAQKDLELRGPGEVFGDRQSGLPVFKVGDPVADFASLQVAQQEVQKIFTVDPTFSQPAYAPLKAYLAQQKQNYQTLD
ncbi:ATP-dependent DNA helicase RecG [Latilactobacillus sakei]|uniref:ATP-dependent DNA helicase RecG n=1 Tax=Latilactobacillus sakei TaxID=1599 RepID=UPI000B97C9D2|nr:ATP-dependent DNA helicase RecG [Latilactobacillus sakei]AST84822.1 ATP-dependent DNA helicase RecG [Latilactobacillus sakei]AWZ43457.1 ATP-dependent DNA helicase RecG [Latilactobacillus sakei]AWZ47217.1 ATP-dependent DNA helicase RecG [Latilactobacillus sakei]AYG17282.1 ATP-dependent DNA helicase RecG [Latilactobacillus sakei]AYG26378.1 ATP-dependent DNA helicase RecG [Latilactobacillus sakei]